MRVRAGTSEEVKGSNDAWDEEDDGENEEEATFDKYRVIKRQTSYAYPEHYERLKDYLFESNTAWGQHNYPCADDDLSDDAEYATVPTEHHVRFFLYTLADKICEY